MVELEVMLELKGNQVNRDIKELQELEIKGNQVRLIQEATAEQVAVVGEEELVGEEILETQTDQTQVIVVIKEVVEEDLAEDLIQEMEVKVVTVDTLAIREVVLEVLDIADLGEMEMEIKDNQDKEVMAILSLVPSDRLERKDNQDKLQQLQWRDNRALTELTGNQDNHLQL